MAPEKDSAPKRRRVEGSSEPPCERDDTGTFVYRRDALPTLPPDSQASLYIAEVEVGGSDIAAAMGLFHSGLTFKLADATAAPEVPQRMTIQWYAIEGLKNAVFPTMGESGCEWRNEARIVFTDDIDETYWAEQTLVADIAGDVFNKLCDFIVGYGQRHKAYQPFCVKSADNSAVVIGDAVCDTFTEASLQELVRLGAKLAIPEGAKLHRNVINLFAASTSPVDLKDEAQAQEMKDYYGKLLDLAKDAMAMLDAKAVEAATASASMGSPPGGMATDAMATLAAKAVEAATASAPMGSLLGSMAKDAMATLAANAATASASTGSLPGTLAAKAVEAATASASTDSLPGSMANGAMATLAAKAVEAATASASMGSLPSGMAKSAMAMLDASAFPMLLAACYEKLGHHVFVGSPATGVFKVKLAAPFFSMGTNAYGIGS